MKKDRSKQQEVFAKEALIIRKKVFELSKSYMFLCLADLNLYRDEDDSEVLKDKFTKSQNIFATKLKDAIEFVQPLVEKGNPYVDIDQCWTQLNLWKHEIECC